MIKFNQPVSKLIIQAAAGVATGIVLAGTATWLGRKVIHITALNRQLPEGVHRSLDYFLDIINLPITIPLGNIKDFGTLSRYVSCDQFTSILTPIIEETIYRYGVQEGTKKGLKAIGIPENQATFVSMALSSYLFALSHDKGYELRFSVTAICGMTFGLLRENYGLPAAIVAHKIYNSAVTHLQKDE